MSDLLIKIPASPRGGRTGSGAGAEAFVAVFKRATANKSRRGFPDSADPRSIEGALFPEFRPKFGIVFGPSLKVFTIGSCFARNIEDCLVPLGVGLPTKRFSVPKSEYEFRPNGLLNEYSVGSISARIADAMRGQRRSMDVIVPNGELFTDLSLAGAKDTSRERAIERQGEIFDVYSELPNSDVVIVTLGLIEAWYDKLAATYLNRMPPLRIGQAYPGRFVFKRLNAFDCLEILEPAVKSLVALGKRIVLTVSPVPMNMTFSGEDCVVANEYSKCTLRICAQKLYETYPDVDYFPSFEIVRSMGLSAFGKDQIHVHDQVVSKVTDFMVRAYGTVAAP